MCDNADAIQSMAADIRVMSHNIARIEKHLEKQNGRIEKLEQITANTVKNLAIQENRCVLMSKYEEKDILRLQKASQSWKTFIKDHIIQIASIATILATLGKWVGWW